VLLIQNFDFTHLINDSYVEGIRKFGVFYLKEETNQKQCVFILFV